MPFINERLEANRETIEKNRAASGPVRASRFRFEPEAVMARLRENIVGQDEALAAMESMLVRVKADIGEENRPLAVHLFLGPTGVGKTETVRLIAEAIHGNRDGLCRIDMNTLAQEHYAAALTGAPPGYVGSKEGHSLFDLDKVQGSFSKPGIVLFDEIEKLVDRRDLTSRFRLVRSRPEIAPLYQSSDLFLFPSLMEGFGLVVVEAAAAGLPIVASHIPGILDSAQASVAPSLVEPYDTEAFVTAVLEVLNQPKSDYAPRPELLEPFDIEASVNRLCRIYSGDFVL